MKFVSPIAAQAGVGGDGSALTNLNASNLASGVTPLARLTTVYDTVVVDADTYGIEGEIPAYALTRSAKQLTIIVVDTRTDDNGDIKLQLPAPISSGQRLTVVITRGVHTMAIYFGDTLIQERPASPTDSAGQILFVDMSGIIADASDAVNQGYWFVTNSNLGL